MPKNDQTDGIDWSLTTWEGSRREQLRRWAALPLERIILAIEEMQEVSGQFRQTPQADALRATGSAQRAPPDGEVLRGVVQAPGDGTGESK